MKPPRCVPLPERDRVGRVSTHLRCLADCGYVRVRRAGRHAFYRVADPRVAQLVLLAHALAADNHTALCACHRIPEPDAADARIA